MMKRTEDSHQAPDNAQANALNARAKNNQKRAPMHVKDEMFNSNDLLKQIMKDCIDEGM